MLNRFIYIFLTFIFVVSTYVSAELYPGRTSVYLLFSFCTFLLMAICFFQKRFLGFVYLSLFLFMGYFYKVNFFLWTKKPLVEAIGSFDFSKHSWDEILISASIGFIGLICSFVCLSIYIQKPEASFNSEKQNAALDFFNKHRKKIYMLSLVLIIIVSTLNITLGIHQVGLSPRTILPWPMNALIAFLINLGFMIFLSVLIYFDFRNKQHLYFGLITIIMSGFFTSVSAISRGLFVFQVLPFLIVLCFYQRHLRTLFLLLCVSILFLFLSIYTTSILRNRLYFNSNQTISEQQKQLIRLEVVVGGILQTEKLIQGGEKQEQHLLELENEKSNLLKNIEIQKNKSANKIEPTTTVQDPTPKPQDSESILSRILNLINSRFIGLEGLMAVQSYEQKSADLFFKAARETRELTTTTMYQEISKSNYRYYDTNHWQFASLPGPVAFLYYSGSNVFIFIGMFVFGLLLLIIEKFIFQFSNSNQFLSSLVACSFANSIAQFGIAPKQNFISYALILISSAVITLIISNVFFISKKMG